MLIHDKNVVGVVFMVVVVAVVGAITGIMSYSRGGRLILLGRRDRFVRGNWCRLKQWVKARAVEWIPCPCSGLKLMRPSPLQLQSATAHEL